jgi:predicted  nucleic acid-binding Zn-ribbon protein
VEWELNDRSTKIADLDRKLYSGTITNSKELSGLQTEIEHMRQALAGVEDRALQTMAELDEARASASADADVVADLEARWRAEERALKTEGQSLVASVEGLRAKRPTLVQPIPAALLARYDDLRRRLHGLAVARVDRNVCLGCRTTLPTSQVQIARQGQIAHCSSCGRFLTVL